MADETSAPQSTGAPQSSPKQTLHAASRHTPAPAAHARRAPRAAPAALVAPAAARRTKFFRRKKVCKFCTEKIDAISYRDVRLLQGFVAERGKIVPRRLTGVCTRHQRGLARHQAGAQHRPAAPSPRASNLCAAGLPDGDRNPGEMQWKSYSRKTSTSSATAAMWLRSPTATAATTCCPASSPWRRPPPTRPSSSR